MRFLRWLVGRLHTDRPAPAPAPAPPPPVPEPKPLPLPPAPAPAPQPALGVVAALNAERARSALAPLREDARLTATAAAWAREMARMSVLFHGDFSRRISAVYPNTAAAEDIAEGAASVAGVVAMWMNSPPHRANILGDYTIAGAGRAESRDGTAYWCVDFDAP